MKHLLFFVGCFVLTTSFVSADAPRPNVVLIMCDDMGYSDIGCFGSEIDTPHINSLAKDGMKFTQFYNCAKCTTTRAALTTGLYPRQSDGLLTRKMLTLGEAMQLAGYQTSLSGKWHLGTSDSTHPYHRGFEDYYGLLDGCCNFFNPEQKDPQFKGGRVRRFAANDTEITEFPDDFYTTDAFTDHAVKMIEQAVAAKKPFFVHICYTAPHYPLHAPEAEIKKYTGKYLAGWEALREARHQRQLEMGLVDPKWEMPDRDPKAKSWASIPEGEREYQDRRMAVYAAMIDRMDQNIGRVLETLKAQGVEENTLVMFLSDNGGCSEQYPGDRPDVMPGPVDTYTTCGPSWAWAQNTPFRRYKTWMHEGGISTPFLAKWPAEINPGSVTNEVGHIIDVLPTLLDVAGGEYPQEHSGQKLIPVEGTTLTAVFQGKNLEEKSELKERQLCWEYAGNRAIRQGKWKLCWDKSVKQWELYDIVADRTETHDLSTEQPERVKAMSAAWIAWAKETGARH